MASQYGQTKVGRRCAPMLRTPGDAPRGEGDPGARRGEARLLRQRLMGYRWNQPAYSLSYANRRRLEIARAMATEPKILLLDEPAAGMNPTETHEITELIGKLRDEGGYTILVIEHDMHVVEGISDRVVALDHGVKIAEGTLRAVATDPRVVEAYLGDEGDGDEVSERAAARTAPRRAAAAARLRRHVLRADPHPPGPEPPGAAGRARLPARRQRVGQVDDAEDRARDRAAAERQRAFRGRGRHLPLDELPDRQGHRDRPREPAAVRADDGAREPRDGRVPPRQGREGGLRPRLRRSSRSCTSGARSWRGRCRAASSRWSRWGGR